MDNPNPIRYSDLITPDDSITKLISQLDALIAKYDEARGKIQTAAADAAKSLQNLSGATEEQRQNIAVLTTESDKLTRAYEQTNNAERETFRRRQQVIDAVKEEQRVDKLLVQIQNSKEGSYNRLSAQYRLNKIRLNEMTAEERNATAAGKQLETETRLIYEEMSRLQKATGKYTLEVGHYENALKGLPGPIGQVVSGMTNMRTQLTTIGQSSMPLAAKAANGFLTVMSGTVGMLMLFVRHLTGSYKTMKEFEQANANLSTILGVTRENMKALTDSALLLGRTTEYTASQVVQLQTELAKLGFGQGSIMNMQKSILQFATAVGANLADAAQVAGSTLRAFNLTSKDTEEVLATLAVATNKSALSFSKIQTSIGTVFPIANAFGLSVKDTTALLGALANAGFDASSAATATRNIILKMVDANGKLAKSMGGSVKTFDGIIEGLNKLRKSGIDLSEALEMTDKRSVSAFSALLSGADSAKELRASLEDVSGELQRISEERLNTVEGSTKMLKSAWEGLTLAFQNSNGAIKDTIDWLTKLIGKVQELLFPRETYVDEATQKWIESFTAKYQEIGADAAESYIDGMVEQFEKSADTAGKAATVDSPINKWLGLGNKQTMAKATADNLKAVQQAAKVVKEQIKNDADELAAQTARDMEEAERKRQELSKEQKRAIEQQKKQRVADLRAVVEAINLEISTTEAGTEKMLELRLDKVEAERQVELELNRQKVKSERQEESAINAKYDRKRLDETKAFNNEVAKLNVQRLQAEQQAIQLEIAITEDGTEEMLKLRLANIEKQREIEIEQNKQKDVKVRQSEKAINAKYDAMRLKESADFNTKLAKRDLEAMQELSANEFALLDRNERQKTVFRLEQEEKRLRAILEINKTATQKMTKEEVEAVEKAIEGIQKQKGRLGYNNLWELLGVNIDPDQQDALDVAINSVKDSLDSLVDSWGRVADAAVASADKQVEAAQAALDAQIEARNNGYANEVETAQKELDLAKKNRDKALQEQARVQKAQAALDTLSQASSLITASANLWKAFSGAGPFGPALAIGAIATMWASFTAAKIRALQATKSEQYAEGTVELLEGGSHASGHDVDLGVKKDGTRRRAEGGEYFAVINKRSSRKYRSIIPDVINSLNNGTFADRYQRANESMSGIALSMLANTDISRLEKDVAAIREQGAVGRYVDANGTMIITYKNLTRKIKS